MTHRLPPVRSARRILAPVMVLGLLLAACASPARIEAPAPTPAPVGQARGPIVSAANPLAAEAGMAVLRRGGSAVDAAVAVQAVLGLVEPQSSGLGGGAFLMHYEAATGAVTAYDGRETAPSAATPELFFENGEPLSFRDAVLSGRSTGAPGAVAMLELAHGRHGRLDWRELFGDAERLADEGFQISPRLAGMIASPAPQASTEWARAYFSGPDGERLEAGDVLRNPAYAATVRAIAAQGAAALSGGPIADEIIAAVRAGERPGALTHADLAAYRPVAREAICREWRLYVICVPPPPSSGLAVLQLLMMAEHVPAVDGGPDDAAAWTAFAQLQRLMYADRDRYVGDADFVDVPVAGLLDPAYAARRAALADGLTGAAQPGLPPGFRPRAADATAEPAGTSHFVVVDAAGNAVSMTTTVESIFGSGRMAGGFFLNNQLTDFSFSPVDAQGRPAANAVAAGKRPRSSMSPVVILDREGRFVGAVGSPGGTSILAYVAKALIGTLAWDMTMQEAIALPNLVARGDGFGADTELFSPALRAELAAAGIELRPNASENSGLHGVLWRDGRWDAGADPRREGVVLGE